MISNVKNLPAEWDDSTNMKWTFKLPGDGWSSPIVWGNQVYVSTAFAEKIAPRDEAPPPPPPPGGENTAASGQNQPPPAEDKSFLNDIFRWELSCIDLETAEKLWIQEARTGNPRIKKHNRTTDASETPVTDEKGVTHVIKAGEKFEVLSQNTLNDTFWTSVAITSNTYLYKGVKRLYCIRK